MLTLRAAHDVFLKRARDASIICRDCASAKDRANGAGIIATGENAPGALDERTLNALKRGKLRMDTRKESKSDDIDTLSASVSPDVFSLLYPVIEKIAVDDRVLARALQTLCARSNLATGPTSTPRRRSSGTKMQAPHTREFRRSEVERYMGYLEIHSDVRLHLLMIIYQLYLLEEDPDIMSETISATSGEYTI